MRWPRVTPGRIANSILLAATLGAVYLTRNQPVWVDFALIPLAVVSAVILWRDWNRDRQ